MEPDKRQSPPDETPIRTLGQLAFEAYTADEHPLPRWIDLDLEVQHKWERTASRVAGAAGVDVDAERARAEAAEKRADEAEHQLAAIDAINEEAWEDGEAAMWVSRIRAGEPLDGLVTQEEYEASYASPQCERGKRFGEPAKTCAGACQLDSVKVANIGLQTVFSCAEHTSDAPDLKWRDLERK